ncbi:MAG: RHS repeat-associated core domain-containing protein [Candidatus Omnitrophica bacterium]|nr:RHS repeat-associated core domain-containing protein [Candidatus Omnitrophota bacterium]
MASVATPNNITTYQYDAQNRLTAVRNAGIGQASYLVSEYTYDGDGGRTRKTVYHRDKAAYSLMVDNMLFNMYGFNLPATDANTTVETTRYVGNIYEDTGIRQTKSIYMGSIRVASADNSGNIFYFHGDHLGSTNVLTDRWGGQREVTEYDPFGQIIRHDQGLNVPKVLTWNYFTGKTLDDESGLMYYGARYYNPRLGRFITPDTIVQAPSNPQTLNRYTYCNNNPVNLVDPSGHGWFKQIWGSVKDFFRDYGGMIGMQGNLINGIINHDWAPLRNQCIAGISAYVFSGGNSIAAGAAVFVTGFLDSKPGRQITGYFAAEVMDDMLGMRPRTAYVWARVTLQILGTLAVENFLKDAVASPAIKSKYDPNDPAQEGINKGYDPAGGRYPGGEGSRGFDTSNPDVKVWALAINGEPTPVAAIGEGSFGGGLFLHVGASSSSIASEGMEKLAFGYEANPLTGYATYFGVCHQASNATLLASGISSTVWDLTPHWSTVASTIAYGNYGGQLPNYVYSGVEAANTYKNP